jgi:hypothetical protein
MPNGIFEHQSALSGQSGTFFAFQNFLSEVRVVRDQFFGVYGLKRTTLARVIAVCGFPEVPFDFNEVATVEVNHRRWNFRKWSDARKPKKSKTASA